MNIVFIALNKLTLTKVCLAIRSEALDTTVIKPNTLFELTLVFFKCHKVRFVLLLFNIVNRIYFLVNNRLMN